ncbi:hypothetical protein QBC47DRAFT_413525 [Echria macrotheca]|uniref:Nitrate reductase n=1 Tax=Echria macrotheca TaxID=438768 RepID=A0AAJ0F9W5_9PEZI|nr:hypothetical protein QBC47DRAFT_413525 [Echria macrotheca]
MDAMATMVPSGNGHQSVFGYTSPGVLSFDDKQTPRSHSKVELPTTVDDISEGEILDARPYALPPRSRENKVLPEDFKTPDKHVERDPRLIRLTGVHPFNVEAPLSDLFDEGFLTTKDLHYVRNHGPVPLVDDNEVLDWRFTIEGMVEKPVEMALRDLLEDYEQLTYPVTLVCAGNRRKEQNVVRKSKGFSWGPAGVSTALWTGVALGDLLARAVPKRGAKYVCFEGADKLPNGYYGTSIKLSWAMDPERGVLVAHKMNGEVLHPDHGKPLRIVIPGQIGGRSVKWLKRIIVTSRPSDNWYHIYDNRVLPTMVTPEASANLPDTWKDERYAIYDLNTNSAICYPAHDETVSLTNGPEMYKLRGYAYGGGGRRVGRLEVTLDQGKSWTLASITYPEDDYRLAAENEILYGGRLDISWRDSTFCWCFWDLDIPTTSLLEAKDVMVRAMDDSMNLQPKDMYWSVLGMMNNPWYRVVIHREGDTLRFEHPTQPGNIPGGWMERVKNEGGNLTNGFWGEKFAGEEEVAEPEPVREVCMVNKGVARTISIEELREHGGEDQPWFVLNGQVYDGTKFLDGHPGGAASIFGAAGQDATEEFMTIRKFPVHSENAKAMMPEYHIGTLDEASIARLASDGDQSPESTEPRPVFLQTKVWSKAVLSSKEKVSPDSKIFTFSLDHDTQTIGLPVGQHLMMRVRDPATGDAIIRAYTPISEDTETGRLRVLVKIYYDTPQNRGGVMTQTLDRLPLGQTIDFKGPVGKFTYLGKGKCAINGRERQVRRFVMVCAGSGITPIFQVLRAVMKDKEDPTTCLVLDGNRVEEDILLKPELDAMAEANADRCKILYALSRPLSSWEGLKGRMDKALYQREVGGPPDTRDVMVLVCGPTPMEDSVRTVFRGMGWSDDDLLFF